MENSEPTRTCGQCHKEVAEANFALHETHCSRFLCVCPDCGENVPRDQLTAHREEQHSLVRCSKCHQKMERGHLQDHELEECVERLQSCEFCELQLPFKELDEHRAFCGSRTERCPDCRRYVKLSEQSQHHLTCSTDAVDDNPTQTSTIKTQAACCRSCMGWFPVEEIDEHELDCVAVNGGGYDLEEEEEDDRGASWQGTAALSSAYQRMSMLGATSRDFLEEQEDEDEDEENQISNCPHCNLALPLLTLRWHQKKCRISVLLKS